MLRFGVVLAAALTTASCAGSSDRFNAPRSDVAMLHVPARAVIRIDGRPATTSFAELFRGGSRDGRDLEVAPGQHRIDMTGGVPLSPTGPVFQISCAMDFAAEAGKQYLVEPLGVPAKTGDPMLIGFRIRTAEGEIVATCNPPRAKARI